MRAVILDMDGVITQTARIHRTAWKQMFNSFMESLPHKNAWQYYQAKKDMEFLGNYGAEMILSTALFWSSITEHNSRSGRYEIKGVMGPDEYHTQYPGSDSPGRNNT